MSVHGMRKTFFFLSQYVGGSCCHVLCGEVNKFGSCMALSFFDGLWTIDRLSILPMTYQRFSPSSFPFLLDGDLDSP